MSKKKTTVKEAMKVAKKLSLSKKIKLACQLFDIPSLGGKYPFGSMTDENGQIIIQTNCKVDGRKMRRLTLDDNGENQ